MEEKKFDLNSLIGFVLLAAITLWWMYTNQPTEADKLQQIKTQDSIAKIKQVNEVKASETPLKIDIFKQDSTGLAQAKSLLGAFGYSASLPSATDNETVLENDLLKIKVANKGGQIIEILLKKYTDYQNKPVYLVKNNNAQFNLDFTTTDHRNLNTKEFYFEPTLTTQSDKSVLSMKLKTSETTYLEYRYELLKDDYMLNFSIASKGLESAVNTEKAIDLNWQIKTIRQEKSIKYENQYTTLQYAFDNGEYDYLNAGAKDKQKTLTNVNWIGFKQQFFTSVLVADKPLPSALIISDNLVNDEELDTVFTKTMSAKIPLSFKNNHLTYDLKWYFGPSDYNILSSYKDKGLEHIINLGWGIFGWINKYLFINFFNFLKGYISSYGIIIILMTIFVRILMSPLVYKSYVSSAKMKVLRPEMEELNAKYKGKENAMKRQQETMALQSKAGVNPMAGCVPALLQMPVFFALFSFFPAAIDLRQQGFLWAKDLSSYDEIINLPFNIPLYGNHVSLFPILASIAIFFYMMMTQSQQMNMQPPAQEGMPDMSKMMKIMMYLSPIMMLVFFNNYGSGLSLYYFISNLLTIFIMLIIKHYIIDEAKIHAQIQENKKKPLKQSKFRERINEAMKKAQEQQEHRKK
ncbi:MAG: membrane protein insertase YidC [Flavobacteriales bacterium CG03_land_8_20_14_0_80_35_15]|nr:MAG: membrane protein insertase YidC [Flavobacteriaceae bacterium CG1_02_35_72]PIV19556.1 MAG: membrane protein insertase YidC [Flavobacteriales bacterium CG03_land_8_20_14_0_80_35_15]